MLPACCNVQNALHCCEACAACLALHILMHNRQDLCSYSCDCITTALMLPNHQIINLVLFGILIRSCACRLKHFLSACLDTVPTRLTTLSYSDSGHVVQGWLKPSQSNDAIRKSNSTGLCLCSYLPYCARYRSLPCIDFEVLHLRKLRILQVTLFGQHECCPWCLWLSACILA